MMGLFDVGKRLTVIAFVVFLVKSKQASSCMLLTTVVSIITLC